MTAMLPTQDFPQNPAFVAHLTILAEHLVVGDYLPFARRIVVAIEHEDTYVYVSVCCPTLTGTTWTHRWSPRTPVIIAPRP